MKQEPTNGNRAWLPGGFLLAAGWLAAGCGGPASVTATGSILENGKPVALSPTGVVQVTLVPNAASEADFTSYVGRTDESGKFEVQEVPPGKYKICVEVLDPTPQDDKLQGALSMHNTKIVREVDGKTPIVVDLAKPES
jgi:hypothetical protein